MKRCWRILLVLLFGGAGILIWLSKEDIPLYVSSTAVRDPVAIDFDVVSFDAAVESHSAIITEAIALTFPGMSAAPIWRDPKSLEPVDLSQLQADYAEFLLDAPISPESPVLFVLVRSIGDLTLSGFSNSNVVDLRTGAKINYEGLDASFSRIAAGGRGRVAISLGIWHDAEVRVMLRPFLTTESAVVQYLPGFDGERVPYLPKAVGDPYYFSIPALPDMPNGRDLENLFEVRIPQLETDDQLEVVRRAGEFRKVPEWDTNEYLAFNSRPNFRKMLFPDQPRHEKRSFRNITVHQLLLEYLKAEESNARFVVDEEAFTLTKVERETLKERLQSWWQEHAPGWLQID